MRRWLAALATTTIILAGAAAPSAAQPVTASEQGLFVQVAPGGRFAEGRVYLDAPAGQTIYFANRPSRLAGRVDNARFLAGWDKGKDSFKDDPPNASLTYVAADGPKVAVVELSDPRLQGGTLSYRARVLEGALPARFKEASLFIDGAGLMCLVCGCC